MYNHHVAKETAIPVLDLTLRHVQGSVTCNVVILACHRTSPPVHGTAARPAALLAGCAASSGGGQSHGGVRVVGGEVGQLGEEEGGS